jgi:hypothetical protein
MKVHNRSVVNIFRKRRIFIVLLSIMILFIVIIINTPIPNTKKTTIIANNTNSISSSAIEALNKLTIKGRAPKTNYSREQFGASWALTNGCDTRNIILNRDLKSTVVDEKCNVTSGVLNDPYTGKTIQFSRGSNTSSDVQIDHVVALSDAWQKGAQQLTSEERKIFANDPLELLAVDGSANLQKNDGDAATWLPSNKSFRCLYVARQIAIKQKYNLWVTQAEHDAISNILDKCPNQLRNHS